MLPDPPTACPDPEVLQDLAGGTLAPDALEQALVHVDGCESCRAAVVAISSEGPPPSGASPNPITATFQPGETVGRYRIDSFVGRGGMGEVYDAFDTVLGERVALKTLTGELMDEPDAIARMRSEVQLAHRVSHRNVCRVRDFGLQTRELPAGRSETIPYLTMEFLQGPTLSDVIRTQAPMRGEHLVAIFRQICEGLAAIHDAGILHRDLKSENVILTEAAGGKQRVVVTDFGLAREWRQTRRSLSGARVAGTAGYMSPEQVLGQPLAPSTDIYALGIVLFEMLTARLPFEAPTAIALAAKRLHKDPPAPSTIHPRVGRTWDRLVLRCLARDPASRPSNVQEVLRLIPAASEREPIFGSTGRRGIAVAVGAGALAAGIFALRASWETGAGRRTTEIPRLQAPAPNVATPSPPAEHRPPAEPESSAADRAPPPSAPPPSRRARARTRKPAVPPEPIPTQAPPVVAPTPEPAPAPASGSRSGRDRLLDPFQQGSP